MGEHFKAPLPTWDESDMTVEHTLSAAPAVVGELRAGDSLVILMSGGPMDAATAAAMRERFRQYVPMVSNVLFIANAVGAVVCRAEEPAEPRPAWAERLLNAFLEGRPLDFGHEPVPEWVRAKLSEARVNGTLGAVRDDSR